MTLTDSPSSRPASPPASAAGEDAHPSRRRIAALALAALLLLSFLLRLWGFRTGLPYSYNRDENAHFVLYAISLFGHGWDPNYFDNPPALIYLLHLVFAVRFGGGDGAARAFAQSPSAVFETARLTSVLLGTASAGLLYLVGRRALGEAGALLAAAILAVAFLPVSYAHLALNDALTILPVSIALLGSVLVIRSGRARDYALAGAGVGLAAATKYTAGIALLPVLGAVGVRLFAPGERRAALRGLALALLAAVAAFAVVDPYALLRLSDLRDALHREALVAAGTAKLGVTEHSGLLYYLWTASWGLGWAPALLALGGAVLLVRDDRRLAALLVPAPVLFILFMGSWDRYFGRWLLPIFPFLCLLAGYGTLRLIRLLAARPGVLGRVLPAAAVALVLAQGLVTSVHNDLVLSRPDTRNTTRAWMVRNIPAGSRVVIEPIVPDEWVRRRAASGPRAHAGRLWVNGFGFGPEYYEKKLSPARIDAYIQRGYCWVVSGSTESGRAYAAPSEAPGAIAYYRELARRAPVVFHASPYDKGAEPVRFNFDWSFNFYPLAYHRPGPEMTVYRLRGGACG